MSELRKFGVLGLAQGNVVGGSAGSPGCPVRAGARDQVQSQAGHVCAVIVPFMTCLSQFSMCSCPGDLSLLFEFIVAKRPSTYSLTRPQSLSLRMNYRQKYVTFLSMQGIFTKFI